MPQSRDRHQLTRTRRNPSSYKVRFPIWKNVEIGDPRDTTDESRTRPFVDANPVQCRGRPALHGWKRPSLQCLVHFERREAGHVQRAQRNSLVCLVRLYVPFHVRVAELSYLGTSLMADIVCSQVKVPSIGRGGQLDEVVGYPDW